MSQSRAFSDTEIVTIAAVAAAALGGIVVGLGRGQEEHRGVTPDRKQISESVKRVRESGRELVPDVSQARAAASSLNFGDDLKRVLRALVSGGESAAQRVAAEAQPAQHMSSVAERLTELTASGSDSVTEQLKTFGLQMIRAGVEKIEDTERNALRASGGDLARQTQHCGATVVEDAPLHDGLIQRLGEEVEVIEQRAAGGKRTAQESGPRVAGIARRRVAEPVSRAASSTGAATKESLAALAWLGVGTAIVYFGLLSDERREQVKDALCGAVEQARLLMLDFQGYEPEM